MVVLAASQTLIALLSIIAGIVVLVFPKILNYAIGAYLIIIGVLYFLWQLGL